MHPVWRRWAVLPVLALLLSVLGCEQGVEPVLEIEAPHEQAVVVPGPAGQRYKLLRERPTLLSTLSTLQVSQIIGLGGGEIRLLGHTLSIPAGAVTAPTLFIMRVVPSGHVEVDLTSVDRLLGLRISRFSKPLTLSLSYARGMNVPSDPSRMLIVYLPGGGYDDAEPIPSEVDTQARVVRARLDHFSGYCIAME